MAGIVGVVPGSPDAAETGRPGDFRPHRGDIGRTGSADIARILARRRASVAQPSLGFDLPPEEHDALCVDAPSVLPYLFDEWIDEKARYEPDLLHPFRIDLAPDDFHKANISGGAPYCIEVPFPGADPLFASGTSCRSSTTCASRSAGPAFPVSTGTRSAAMYKTS